MPEMAAVSTRDEYTGAMLRSNAYTRSWSDPNMWGGHSVSTADVSADVSTAAAMSTTTMSATAATVAPAFRGSIGCERQAAKRENCGQCKD